MTPVAECTRGLRSVGRDRWLADLVEEPSRTFRALRGASSYAGHV
jgi:hypothetical protein